MPKNNADNTIAYMGVPGSNGDIACRQNYPYMHTLACQNFEEVIQAVAEGKALYGMIPIENSQAGRVAEFHQLLPNMNLHIVAEHFQNIEHYLLAPKGATLQTLKQAYSHPQALMQTRNHLRSLGLTPITYASTALAAQDVAKWQDVTKAAVAPLLAAELYGLVCLKEHLEDNAHNVTVFVTVAREAIIPKTDKNILTTLIFTVRNIPAVLYKALGGFATNGINLLKIESYIAGGVSKSAQFFITFEGSPKSKNVQLALEELDFYCENVRIMGVYPADSKRY